MGALGTSNRTLVVASGERIQSEGRWSGWISMGEERAEVDLEVFDSKGTFGILLGKPFLAGIGAVQDYAKDALRVGGRTVQRVVRIEAPPGIGHPVQLAQEEEVVRWLEAIIAGRSSPEEGEEEGSEAETEGDGGDSESDTSDGGSAASELEDGSEGEVVEGERSDEATYGGGERMDDLPEEGAEVQAVHSEGQSRTILNPFAEERLTSILTQVQIGPDLSVEEHAQVEALVREFADVFTLSLREVKPVDFIEHKLTIKEGATLPTRVHQRPLTEVQKAWYLGVLDEMEAAGICCRIPAEEVKCVSATTLAPKDSGGGGMTREEIIARANELCQGSGLPDFYVGEQGEPKTPSLQQGREAKGGHRSNVPTSWRICHAYMTLNRNTQVPPFLQGNLYLKQQRMAGKRWTSVIDFAAGYYAIPVAEDSIPYTAFYVEGRGYYSYCRMPFGLTGAPTTFCEMVSQALDDMIGRELETWMDDICLSGNDFGLKMKDLRKFFGRCRDKKLSLAPSKCKLFQSEVLFAGAKLSGSGVGHNSKKIEAVLNWPIPGNALELLGFLGLTNTYRRLIPGYASIAAPLTDLTREVKPEKPKQGQRLRRGAYKAALRKEQLTFKWGRDQERAFVALKCLVTSDQVMRPAVYDGRPFRVTSDASKVGFGAVLEQEYAVSGSDSKSKQYWHPIAFASKRTSRSEEKYTPFLLEFAALKFALDEFRPFIWGSPVEVETDCQALRDFLRREDLSATHARWRDALLEFMIIERYQKPVAFMADGGSHFTGQEVKEFCEQEGIHHITTPAYSPWVNGLAENTNKLIIGRLRRLCSPDLNTTTPAEIDTDSIPKQWPKHLETAVAQLNDRILPATRYAPRELLFGVMMERGTPAEPDAGESGAIEEVETEIHMALAAIQRAEAGVRWAEHGKKRKAKFDKRVREVEFRVGEVVQVYDSRAEGSHETKFKILPRWSPPVRVRERRVNSYELETLGGAPLKGRVHARRLRSFGTGNAPRSAPVFKGGHLGQGTEEQRS
ncbi:hypothetical protein FRC01_008858 [Tulasnella sp. 417]|nr:hypothetical protein FRC01_008858 [Tulasnella sp. 417]